MINRINFLLSSIAASIFPIPKLPEPITKIRENITFIPADKPSKLRLGWVVYENICKCGSMWVVNGIENEKCTCVFPKRGENAKPITEYPNEY